jgi:hypothetical protein
VYRSVTARAREFGTNSATNFQGHAPRLRRTWWSPRLLSRSDSLASARTAQGRATPISQYLAAASALHGGRFKAREEMASALQIIFGGFLPIGYIAAVAAVVIRVGRFLDRHLKTQTKKDLLAYLENGGLEDTGKSLVNAAGNSIDNIFGERHFSLKCLLRSMALTLIFNTFFIALSGLLSFVLTLVGNNTFNKVIALYWSFLPLIGLKALVTWLIWSFFVDYFSLLKTRFLIRLLQRSKSNLAAPVLCVLDFIAGFAIYAFGISLLSLLSLFTHSGAVAAPTISLELSGVIMMFMVLYARATMANLDSLLAAHGQLTQQALTILHTNAPQYVLLALFLIQLTRLMQRYDAFARGCGGFG